MQAADKEFSVDTISIGSTASFTYRWRGEFLPRPALSLISIAKPTALLVNRSFANVFRVTDV